MVKNTSLKNLYKNVCENVTMAGVANLLVPRQGIEIQLNPSSSGWKAQCINFHVFLKTTTIHIYCGLKEDNKR